jgi:hypothetical protein
MFTPTISQPTTPNVGQFINQHGALNTDQYINQLGASNTNQHINQAQPIVPQNKVIVVDGVKPKSVARADQRTNKKEKDVIFEARQVVGKKPHHM